MSADPEPRKVQRTLREPPSYKTVKVAQFDISSYYRANAKTKSKPMFAQHGLQNFTQFNLGDNRLRYERSFYHEVMKPHISRPDPDKGLPEEHVLSNRKRDYVYVRKVFNDRIDDVCNEVIAAIKAKLKMRTKVGLYELIETFKHFTEEKSTITIAQMRMVFEMMGFSFSDNQVLALFAKYDPICRGELNYKAFITLLTDGDIEEVQVSWLPKKGEPVHVPPECRDCTAECEDRETKLEERRQELAQTFTILDTKKEGVLVGKQLEYLLTIVGADLVAGGTAKALQALTANSQHGVTFEEFWAWHAHNVAERAR